MPRTSADTSWRLDVSSRELLFADGRQVRLPEKPFRVLEALVEADGGVVTRAALGERLWPDDTFVEFDNNLNSAVATLRHALGDSARDPVHIETIPKVGYRLVVRRSARRPGRRVLAAAVAGGLIVATIGAVGYWRRADASGGTALSVDPDAARHVARGRYLRGRFAASHDASLLTSALAAFHEALRIDPTFTAARAERADTLVEMSFAAAIGFRDGLEQARAEASLALERQPAQPVAARVTGLAALFLDWDLAGARAWLDRASATLGDAPTALAWATWFAAAGDLEAAVAEAERAVALDPAAYFVRADLAMFYLAAGRNRDAAAASLDVLDTAPGFVPALTQALLAHERLARWSEAADLARRLMAARGAPPAELAALDGLDGRAVVEAFRRWDLAQLERQAADRRADYALSLALRHAALGERGAAVDDLELALSRRAPLLVFVRAFPELAVLRGDARFEALVRMVTAGAAPPA